MTSKKFNKKLTIIIPTYNRAETLPGALERLTSQIRKVDGDITILISENHSTDASLEIAKHYAEKNRFITIIIPEKHLPSGEENLIFALESIKGGYVWTFADDDTPLPNAVQTVYEKIRESDAEFFLLNAIYKNSSGELLTENLIRTSPQRLVFQNIWDLIMEVGITTSVASFTSAVFKIDKTKAYNGLEFLKKSTVYAHVFYYIKCFSGSKSEIIYAPLVIANQLTDPEHWEKVGKHHHWYRYYPWTGGLTKQLLELGDEGAFEITDIPFMLTVNQYGRSNFATDLTQQLFAQLKLAILTKDDREIPPENDFDNIARILSMAPFVSHDTIMLIKWAKWYFGKKTARAKIIKSSSNNKIAVKISENEFMGFKGLLKNNEIESIFINKADRICSDVNQYNVYLEGTTKPYVITYGSKYSIIRIGNRYVVINNSTLLSNWKEISPWLINFPESIKEDGWHIRSNYQDAYSIFVRLEDMSEANFCKNLFSKEQWDLVKNNILHSNTQRFCELAITNPQFKALQLYIHSFIKYFFGLNKEVSIHLLETQMRANTRLIDLQWYQNTFSNKTTGFERLLINQYPIVHYFIMGHLKSWSLSPYMDEGYYTKPTIKEYEKIPDLFSFITSEIYQQYSIDFDSDHYLSAYQYRDRAIQHPPPIQHFVDIGINLGYLPTADWDESGYLALNPDVQDFSISKMKGWEHWRRYGRFEGRLASKSNSEYLT